MHNLSTFSSCSSGASVCSQNARKLSCSETLVMLTKVSATSPHSLKSFRAISKLLTCDVSSANFCHNNRDRPEKARRPKGVALSMAPGTRADFNVDFQPDRSIRLGPRKVGFPPWEKHYARIKEWSMIDHPIDRLSDPYRGRNRIQVRLKAATIFNYSLASDLNFFFSRAVRRRGFTPIGLCWPILTHA